MDLPEVFEIVAICAAHGVQKVVLSPGSRCAPLTIAFVRHPNIQCYTISDERSAAHIALGIALKSGAPTALVSTSGTAALNYAPAIAEAFYQQVPLLIFTANRPYEWIDQWDGQAIRQENIFDSYIKFSASFPVQSKHPDEVWHCQRIINEACIRCKESPHGPVHLNVPFREPFYPEENEKLYFPDKPRLIHKLESKKILSSHVFDSLCSSLPSTGRILLIPGQQKADPHLIQKLHKFPFPILAEVISNFQHLPHAIKYHDLILMSNSKDLLEVLKPDLIITWGMSIVSKTLKSFLRKYKPAHWHVQEGSSHISDPFQSLTKKVSCEPSYFFEKLITYTRLSLDRFYLKKWLEWDRIAQKELTNFAKDSFSEIKIYQNLLSVLPDNCDLHLANSMAVRYASLVGVGSKKIEVFCNRGVSGIDGSNSTAVGSALESGKLTVLITGDVAFFYDRNAFWHNYSIPNLRVIMINNHAGAIFGIIPAPQSLPEREEYFETKQMLSAKYLANEFGFEYFHASSFDEVRQSLANFFENGRGVKILEIECDKKESQEVFISLKRHFAHLD